MNIFQEADYKTYTAFSPVYSPEGLLTSVGLLNHFTRTSDNVAIAQEILTPLLNVRQRGLLLQQQINLVEKHHHFFNSHNLKAAINIDQMLAETILNSEFILKKMSQLDCLQLEVTESFPALNSGRHNIYLQTLSEKFHLSLNNYGAGKTSSKAVFDDLFHRIKLDKGFIQHNIKRLSFPPFIKAILDHIKPHCHEIVVQGVDDIKTFEIIRHYPFDGFQGALFPAVGENRLIQLVKAPLAVREPQL